MLLWRRRKECLCGVVYGVAFRWIVPSFLRFDKPRLIQTNGDNSMIFLVCLANGETALESSDTSYSLLHSQPLFSLLIHFHSGYLASAAIHYFWTWPLPGFVKKINWNCSYCHAPKLENIQAWLNGDMSNFNFEGFVNEMTCYASNTKHVHDWNYGI